MSKYLYQTNTFNDSVIYYSISNDTLRLKFPVKPQNRRWKFSYDFSDRYIEEINSSNEIFIKDSAIIEYSKQPVFYLIAAPSDTLLYFHSRTLNLIHFTYKSDGNGKLIRMFAFSADVVNINYVFDIKDKNIVQFINDSIQRRLTSSRASHSP